MNKSIVLIRTQGYITVTKTELGQVEIKDSLNNDTIILTAEEAPYISGAIDYALGRTNTLEPVGKVKNP